MQIPRIQSCWFAVAIASITIEVFGGQVAPVGLLVNGVSNPLAIERDATRFTWRSGGCRPGRNANRVSDPGFLKPPSAWPQEREIGGTAARWIRTNRLRLNMRGKPLPPATRFWWKVRVWDQTGKPSAYSAPACFDTGLAQNEWTARYIWDGTTNLNNFAYFRKTFSITSQPNLAKVYVTAHNDYLLYLQRPTSGPGAGPLRSLSLRAIQCL